MRSRLFACVGLMFVVCASAAAGYRVYGEIGKAYQRLGGERGFLGAPLTDETGTPDSIGRFNHFQNGSIYWTPATGAHEVHGQIRDKWASMGWERSPLGYPITDELSMGDGRGRYSNFQGGTIFWSEQTGPHVMNGPIMPKWVALKGSTGFLGYPVTDEVPTPDGVGRYVHFEGGSIYWHPETGAHEVHGAIRDRWAASRWEKGLLGYPTSDEYKDGIYRRSNFQRGYIRWTAERGAIETVRLAEPVGVPVEE